MCLQILKLSGAYRIDVLAAGLGAPAANKRKKEELFRVTTAVIAMLYFKHNSRFALPERINSFSCGEIRVSKVIPPTNMAGLHTG